MHRPKKPHPGVNQARIAIDTVSAEMARLVAENEALKAEAEWLRGLKLMTFGDTTAKVVRDRFHGAPQMNAPGHRSAVDHGHTGVWTLYLDNDAPKHKRASPTAVFLETVSEAEAIAWCLTGVLPQPQVAKPGFQIGDRVKIVRSPFCRFASTDEWRPHWWGQIGTVGYVRAFRDGDVDVHDAYGHEWINPSCLELVTE